MLTFQTRAKTSLWPQIEVTFKQMDTAATELECFEALQKQELLAASHRISGIWEEVHKQKELERTLQLRYGNLLADLEKMQKVMDEHKARALKEEEIAAANRALQLAAVEAEAEANQTIGGNVESSEAVSALAVDHENSMPVTSSPNEIMGEQPNSSEGQGHEHGTSSAMDIGLEKENAAVSSDIGLSDNKPTPATENTSFQDNGFENSDQSHTGDVPSQELSAPPANGTPEVTTVVENKITDDLVHGVAIENAEIVEGVKDVENQLPVIESGSSDVNSTHSDSAAPAFSNEDGPATNDDVEIPRVASND